MSILLFSIVLRQFRYYEFTVVVCKYDMSPTCVLQMQIQHALWQNFIKDQKRILFFFKSKHQQHSLVIVEYKS